ncbi:MAG: NADH:ubiquinone reductase (Na(+)-transporting) subunit E [Deltaproteobacteria bacterium]|nr:NADH:ubiquinone reductase (Na(+)-transporting) subunit E [Deltaproteobacteria bacterium]
MDITAIFIASIFTHNIALAYFLGMCPFIALSGDLRTASGMSMAVTFVMTIAAAATWPIYHKLLVPFEVEYLQYVLFILVIAALVQIVEMVIERSSPVLYNSMGVFLPLITVNCAILGVTLFMIVRDYSYMESLVYSFGSGIGWGLAILAMAAIRERLRFANVPEGLKGPGITMIIAGLMAMGFMGFAGMLNVQ